MTTAIGTKLDFRQLVEASPEVTLVLAADAPNYTILAASDAYTKATLKERDELIGKGLFEVFPEHHDDPRLTEVGEVRRSIEETIETKSICTVGPFRFDLKRPDALGGDYEERYWTQRNVPVCDDSGEVIYVIHRVEEVTEFILQERSKDWRIASGRSRAVVEELRQALEQKSRRQYYDMFLKAPAFIAMLEGPNHVFTMANPAYYELVDHREVIGHTVGEVFPEEEIHEFIPMLNQVYETGEPQYFSEQEILLRNSETGRTEQQYATFAYLPSRDLFGKIEGVACFGFEVTELVEARKEVEEQAARAQRENKHKDEFLAMLGHELRNPLAPIGTAVEVLRAAGDSIDAERVEWGADLIQRQLGQLIRLVDDLLDVARINQGRIELKRERCAFEEVISAALESCRPLIERKDQQLCVHTPESLPPVEIDAARINQVLANLLNNASKYTQPGGHIELTVEIDEQALIVEVSDNGKGIDPEVLPSIFDLFTQADTTLDRSQGGLGVGLTLVRRLVEMHDGRVQAFSEGPGRGSCFRVELPVVVEPSAPLAEDVAAGSHDSYRRRVLVVDDNRDAADALAMMLTVQGNQVEVAYDGKSALEVARQFLPEYIFLDIGLPEMDGYQVASQLRQEEAFADTVLVALTGYGQEDDKARALTAGFDVHLVKPAQRDDIEAALAQPR